MLATTSLPPILWPNLEQNYNVNFRINSDISKAIRIGEGFNYLSLRSRLSTVPANSKTHERYTVDVVRIAQIVPIGMDFCASARSPDRFEPAIIPEQGNTKVISKKNDILKKR